MCAQSKNDIVEVSISPSIFKIRKIILQVESEII